MLASGCMVGGTQWKPATAWPCFTLLCDRVALPHVWLCRSAAWSWCPSGVAKGDGGWEEPACLCLSPPEYTAPQ
jgi:hypothetical protein